MAEQYVELGLSIIGRQHIHFSYAYARYRVRNIFKPKDQAIDKLKRRRANSKQAKPEDKQHASPTISTPARYATVKPSHSKAYRPNQTLQRSNKKTQGNENE